MTFIAHLITAIACLFSTDCAVHKLPMWTTANDESILFAEKNFFDSGSQLSVSGTLTGENIAYRNNTYVVTCFQDLGKCFTTYIEQIGEDHIGRMDNISYIPIVKWDNYEIVASEEDSLINCFKDTITIVRGTKDVYWVREPINAVNINCHHSTLVPSKWKIDDSLGQKYFKTKIPK